MRHMFTVECTADKPIVVGQDNVNGRRQLIVCPTGKVTGQDIDGTPIEGEMLGGCVDSQIIRPNGRCDLSARYAVRLSDGRSYYIQNDGMRTVPPEYAQTVFNGEFVDPNLYYFVTVPKIEVYDDSLRWMENHVFFCLAERMPSSVKIKYYMIEKEDSK